MKLRVKKIVALLLAVTAMLSLPMQSVKAAEDLGNSVQILPCTIVALNDQVWNNSTRATTFSDTTINVSCSSAGMYIAIFTSMTKEASVVGVKDIVVQRKVGFWWETVATASGGEVYNSTGLALNMTYTGAVYNETYRISCVHYGNVDGYRELEHTTENFKFVY